MPYNPVQNQFADGIKSFGASLFDPAAKAKAAQINSQLSTDELQRQKLRLDIGKSTQEQGATSRLAEMFGNGSLLEQKPDGTFGIPAAMRNEYVKNYAISRPNASHLEIFGSLNAYVDSLVKQRNEKGLQAERTNSLLSTDELQRQKLRLDIGRSTQEQEATNHLADMIGNGGLLEQKPDGTIGISTAMRKEFVKNYALSRPNTPLAESLSALNTYEDGLVKQRNLKALQADRPRTGAEVIGSVLEKTDPKLVRLHALDIKPLQSADGSFITPPAIQRLYEGGSGAAPQFDQTDAPPDYVPSAKPPGPTSLTPEMPTGSGQAPVIPGLSAKDTVIPRDAGSALFGGEAAPAQPIHAANQPEQPKGSGAVADAFSTAVPTMGPKKPVAPEGRKLSPLGSKIFDGIVQATDTLGSLESVIGVDGKPGLVMQNPDAFGMKNYAPNDFTQRSHMKGFADGVRARVTVMRIANNAIHALYGGALTTDELKRAKTSEVFETDTNETVVTKLQVLQELTQRHLATLKVMGSRESGYITNPQVSDLIDRHLGAPPPQAQPAQPAAPQAPAAPDFGTHFNGKRILKVEQVK